MPRALRAAQCLAQSELHARCWLPSYRFPEPPFPGILPRGDTAQCTVEFVAAGLGSAAAPAAAFQICTVVVFGPRLPTDVT